MKLIHGTTQHGVGTKTGSQFTGTVHAYLTMQATDGVTINTVNFTPGARTYWHVHEHGQILQVLAGSGYVGTEQEGIRRLRAGDTVWCPPGERHWHGAAPDSFMTHTAISLGTTSWAEEVGTEQYPAPVTEED
ncbi:cupin domain-containing protein [Streptomyces sp. V4I2]|uniref:cupin domain-containing protein n=1 Tax=Streptomyces sp. V4I2 TaxID=3042280 RepID=UPI00278596C7|nr:cupin domain-containing protein [Streptomyces sp. V4I2]MDQ1042388.1 quercetin dioxygenase-like cupin family protein [Streptomyces sp. V4I2]